MDMPDEFADTRDFLNDPAPDQLEFGASLVDLQRAEAGYELRRRTSWSSSGADVALPESEASSLVDAKVPDILHEKVPEEASAPYLGAKPHQQTPPPTRKVKIDLPEETSPSRPVHSSPEGEDGNESDIQPLWYRSQTFSSRYGALHREPLLRPPLRSHSLPVAPKESKSKIPTNLLSNLTRKRNERSEDRPTSGQSIHDGPEAPISPARRKDDRLEKDRSRLQIMMRNNHSMSTTRRNTMHSRGSPSISEERGTTPRTNGIPQQTPGPIVLEIVKPRDTTYSKSTEYPRVRRQRTDDTMQGNGEHSRLHSSSKQLVRRIKTARSGTSRPTPPVYASESVFQTYSALVSRLVTHMPQLINVRGEGCRNLKSGHVWCYDTLESGGLPHFIQRISATDPQFTATVNQLPPARTRNVRFRYILVEDLSPLMIHSIGSAFWPNPEFFEEHLNQSGFQPNSYADPHPRTWNTNAAPKDYASVRWFRPVHRHRVPPFSELDRDKLLMKGGDSGDLRWKSALGDDTDEKRVRSETNIFRREWPLVSDLGKTVSGEPEGTFPAAWEERLTVHVSNIPGRPPTFIILLDPLPTLHVEPTKSRHSHTQKIPFTQAYSRAPIGPRFGLLDVFNGGMLQEITIRRLGSNLASTNSTVTDLNTWLENMHTDRRSNSDLDMLTGLLWIIHRDVVGFLQFVSSLLEEIGLHATDDYLIQKQLVHWRQLITRFQTELPAMRLSIKLFFEFAAQYVPLGEAEGFVQRTLDLIDNLIEENEKSYAALRADMALLESKRAIDQAESVGKLTELGFLFIPISCIASIFSMQVESFETPVPMYAFITAITLTIGLLYMARLTIRSAALIEYKRELSRRIRMTTKLPPGASIPTRTFLFYMTKDVKIYLLLSRIPWRPLGVAALMFLSLALVLLPVVMLWTRNKKMDISYKGIFTVVIFLFSFGVVVPFVVGPLRRRWSLFNVHRSRGGAATFRLPGHQSTTIEPRYRDFSPSPTPSSTTRARPRFGVDFQDAKDRTKHAAEKVLTWMLGRQNKVSDDEATSYTSHSSSSRTRRARPRRRNTPPTNSAPSAREPELHQRNQQHDPSRLALPWTDGHHSEEPAHPLQADPDPILDTHRRENNDSRTMMSPQLQESDDEAYEQLTPAWKLQPRRRRRSDSSRAGKYAPGGRRSEREDSDVSGSTGSVDPDTALVLWEYGRVPASASASATRGRELGRVEGDGPRDATKEFSIATASLSSSSVPHNINRSPTHSSYEGLPVPVTLQQSSSTHSHAHTVPETPSSSSPHPFASSSSVRRGRSQTF